MTTNTVTIESLKTEFATLADFNSQSSAPASTWAQAAKISKADIEAAKAASNDLCQWQITEDSKTVYAEPESLRVELGEYVSLFDLRAQGTASKSGFNDAIQEGLTVLADSGNKKFQLIKAILWIMATDPAWDAEYKQVCRYIKTVTPFRVASKVKKSTMPDGRVEKELIIQLIKVKGASWRKRPACFWNRVSDKNESETKQITTDQLNSRLEKICEQVSEAKLDESSRLVAAATFLDNLGLSDLAASARELIMDASK